MNAIEEIEKRAKLCERGVLTEEEFQELKVYTLSSEIKCRMDKRIHYSQGLKLMDALRLSILLTLG